jgi:hypothetical protein
LPRCSRPTATSEICAALDEGQRPACAHAPDPADLAGLQAPRRLSARKPKVVSGFTVGKRHPIVGAEGLLASWSPLVGLTCDGTLDLGREVGVVLTAAEPEEIVTIEDKDTRRDLGDLAMSDTPVACIAAIRETKTATP